MFLSSIFLSKIEHGPPDSYGQDIAVIAHNGIAKSAAWLTGRRFNTEGRAHRREMTRKK
jgi:hypothetical protein